MINSHSSKKWFKKHNSDFYVTKAHKLSYRSRSSFKIIEIQKKYKIFKKNSLIVDLGASPGGWSQLINNYIKPNGKIIALDLNKMPPITGVDFIQGDFASDKTLKKLDSIIKSKKIDCIASDMAPNMSGNKNLDQAQLIFLLELALELAISKLKQNGCFIAKIFQGSGTQRYLKQVKNSFKKVSNFKPQSSRPKSREFYIIAQGFYTL